MNRRTWFQSLAGLAAAFGFRAAHEPMVMTLDSYLGNDGKPIQVDLEQEVYRGVLTIAEARRLAKGGA